MISTELIFYKKCKWLNDLVPSNVAPGPFYIFNNDKEWQWTGCYQCLLPKHSHCQKKAGQHVGNMFEATFPLSYGEYKKAFEAGVFVEKDPGPWLGRAIVYKLDGSLHRDKKDFGPAACIPCGFSGGQMLVPELKVKFM